MTPSATPRVGFACAYTPLPLLAAAGLTPYRVLPLGDAPDQAGQVLHDNLCPHVKRILDRALADELPALEAMVFMESCDAMRRLADAWRASRPDDRVVLIDLPVDDSDRAVQYFAERLGALATELGQWSGQPVTGGRLAASVQAYDELAAVLQRLGRQVAAGKLPGGRAALQRMLARSVTEPVPDVLADATELAEQELGASNGAEDRARVPVFVFGNVLPDPAAFELLERCGVAIVGDDLCTGSRQLTLLEPSATDRSLDQALSDLARAVLTRPSCARTLGVADAAALGRRIAATARAGGARGVIAHVMKFCDPYLARLPMIQHVLREASLPVLILEGDCTLRSLGQHQTRIEAFVEMIGDGAP